MQYGFAVFIQGMANSKIEVGVSTTTSDKNAYDYPFNLTWKNNSVTWKMVNNWEGYYSLNGKGAKYYYVAIG